jgi:hypothetical protein
MWLWLWLRAPHLHILASGGAAASGAAPLSLRMGHQLAGKPCALPLLLPLLRNGSWILIGCRVEALTHGGCRDACARARSRDSSEQRRAGQ